MELALGQYHRCGCLSIWDRICPALKGKSLIYFSIKFLLSILEQSYELWLKVLKMVVTAVYVLNAIGIYRNIMSHSLILNLIQNRWNILEQQTFLDIKSDNKKIGSIEKCNNFSLLWNVFYYLHIILDDRKIPMLFSFRNIISNLTSLCIDFATENQKRRKEVL